MADSVFGQALKAFAPTRIRVWSPYPKQQRAADLAGSVFELLYGGAAGGGKSMFLRCYAVEFALRHPRSHIGLVRRTLPRLKQTHGLHLDQLTEGFAKVNRTESTWKFDNRSVIRFISLQNENDQEQYKSAEFDLLLFDEVTELLEEQYTFMLSRVRSAAGYRAHVIATANPEGRGFRWVKKRWVQPRPTDLAPGQEMPVPYESWAPPIVDEGEIIGWHPSRAFIPATVYDNPILLENNPTYVQQLRALPDGRLRRALLDGDWSAMDSVPGALWDQTNIDENRVGQHPELFRIVIGVDPAGSSQDGADECGIVAVGLGRDNRFYVLRDFSRLGRPDQWAKAVVRLYDEVQADMVIAEVNYGGEMVEATLNHERSTLPVKLVRASRGKAVRAEPISVLYRKNRVSHVGTFLDLEDQLCTWTPDSGWSPDRLDALVWALTELGGGSGIEYLNAISVSCPKCGIPNVSAAIACFSCGHDLTELREDKFGISAAGVVGMVSVPGLSSIR
jgi:hypothetical protein